MTRRQFPYKEIRKKKLHATKKGPHPTVLLGPFPSFFLCFGAKNPFFGLQKAQKNGFEKIFEIFLFFFEKPIAFSKKVCYNIKVVKTAP